MLLQPQSPDALYGLWVSFQALNLKLDLIRMQLRHYPRSMNDHHFPRKILMMFQAFRSEEHTSELQSRENLVCRLLLEKKKKINEIINIQRIEQILRLN